jgi:hypothetical protein
VPDAQHAIHHSESADWRIESDRTWKSPNQQSKIKDQKSRMIRHIVFWRFKDDVAADARPARLGEIREKFEALNGVIPGLIHLEIAADFSRNAESSDFVLYSEFESRAALDGYQAHPRHRELMPMIAAVRSERRVVDYER